MKKIEPTKNVTPMPGRETLAHCAASAATVKHSEPSANSTLIHQLRRRGRHQVGSPSPPAGVAPAGDGARGRASLAVRARAPAHLGAVGPAQDFACHKRTRAVGGDAFPALGDLDVTVGISGGKR